MPDAATQGRDADGFGRGFRGLSSIAEGPSEVARPYLDLFLVSFALLFTELAFIRWFGSSVIFLTFFTNIVLMACFLGMSVGCLAARRKFDFAATVTPLALLAVGLAAWSLKAHFQQDVTVKVSGQDSPQLIYFGAEPRMTPAASWVVPIELAAGIFFTLIALSFVGLGQVMGRAFDAIPNRIAAYSVNIFGSLAGIVAFGWASARQQPPLVWFAVAAGLMLCFALRWRRLQVASAMLMLVVVFSVTTTAKNHVGKPWNTIFWSPYYRIDYDPDQRLIRTNNISHQQMVAIEDAGPAYALPHLLDRDAGLPPFDDVLIIGAGSGNDVQAALKYDAKHVDAVEIDPVILDLGRIHHPKTPYSDPRVTAHNDDGRSFLRKTDKKYDLVIYALVDSLVLHSGYSSLRLESFLFTEQAFRDVERVLKPDGLFVMYNYYRRGWVVGRLVELSKIAFGGPPIVMSLPYQPSIKVEGDQSANITCVVSGRADSGRLKTLHERLDAAPFWAHMTPRFNEEVNAFGSKPPDVAGTRPEHWQKIAPAQVETAGCGPLPTDRWPFLYLRSPAIPGLTIRGMALLGLISAAILAAFSPSPRAFARHLDGRMLFLGAGFMLLETKGVVHMALLFGSTWVVNSVVFAAILVMILLANLFVLIARPKKLAWAYGALVVALVLNAVVPMEVFLDLPGSARVLASCGLVFVPIFFAGVIFATSFRETAHPDVAIGSNILGAIVGGLAENLSLVLGFDYLLLVALGFYAASAYFPATGRKLRADSASPLPVAAVGS